RSRPPSGRRPSLRRSAACSTSCAGATRATRSRRGGEVHPELEALLALQEKDQAVTATDAALAALAPELSTLDEAQAAAERARATAGLSAALLARYERIRRGKAPLALYPLHGDACGHCFTAVPTQRRALIQRGASIEGCEACGVLLYAPE